MNFYHDALDANCDCKRCIDGLPPPGVYRAGIDIHDALNANCKCDECRLDEIDEVLNRSLNHVY